MAELLISADSHVRVPMPDLRARIPASLHEAFDDALAMQAGIDAADKGGKEFSLASWDMEAFKDPGYWEPHARLAAMDRDGVHAEVLYSELSGFRAFSHVKGDWRPISRAFLDLLADFAAVDPDRLAISYQIPLQDIDYAVSEVVRLAGLGARSGHLPNFPSELGLPDYHETHYDVARFETQNGLLGPAGRTPVPRPGTDDFYLRGVGFDFNNGKNVNWNAKAGMFETFDF